MQLKGKKLVFLGDSITQGIGTSDEKYIYWQRLGAAEECVVKGYGISGTRIARQQRPGNEPHEEYFGLRVPKMDADADVVVVFGGTNDYGHGDAALGKMSDRTDDTFYGAVHNLLLQLINKYPTAQLVMMTPCHRDDENADYNAIGVRNVANLETYVNIIKEVAAYYGVPVLDLYRCSGLQPAVEELKKRYMPDGLHPSDAGHERIFRCLREFLKNL